MNKIPNIVILEDDPNRIKKFKEKLSRKANVEYFTDVEPCISYVKKNKEKIDTFFLDHDLGGEIFVPSSVFNTGYTMALNIKNIYGNDYPQIIVHSLNPAGADNIASVLTRADKIPFPLLINSI